MFKKEWEHTYPINDIRCFLVSVIKKARLLQTVEEEEIALLIEAAIYETID